MFMPIIRNKRRKVLILASAFLIIFHRSVSYSVIPEETLFVKKQVETKVIEAKPEQIAISVIETSPEAISIENDPIVQNDHRAIALDKIVQPITTVTEFVGGQQERNRGSGFVVGNRFFTVNHNLTTAFPSLRVKSTSFIDGMSVSNPVFSNKEQDVAVFDLSDRLCVKYCNDTEVDFTPDFSSERKVYWLRKFEDDFILKEANILGSVTFGSINTPAELTCDDKSVVLVDQPFIPGSSGSPIMDAESGKIIGVIQGSVDEDDDSKGYFKPINCVLAMLSDHESSQTFAKL
ncbi:MAG: trypsin-like peptidase domain-containing protein [Gammaproteobacteria bacterium]